MQQQQRQQQKVDEAAAGSDASPSTPKLFPWMLGSSRSQSPNAALLGAAAAAAAEMPLSSSYTSPPGGAVIGPDGKFLGLRSRRRHMLVDVADENNDNKNKNDNNNTNIKGGTQTPSRSLSPSPSPSPTPSLLLSSSSSAAAAAVSSGNIVQPQSQSQSQSHANNNSYKHNHHRHHDDETVPILPSLDVGTGNNNHNGYDTIVNHDRNHNSSNNRSSSDPFLEKYENETSKNRSNNNHNNHDKHNKYDATKTRPNNNGGSGIQNFVAQIPAIAIACLLNLMLSIPFGVAYFPVEWTTTTTTGAGDPTNTYYHTTTNTTTTNDSNNSVDDPSSLLLGGPFPMVGKESLGIRMCLFSTLIGQLVMTYTSKFTNPICFQMVENIPFFHALAVIVITQQGYGKDALSTLFFLLGLSSVIVGIVFYLLGRLELGRIVYFFPNHVLVGCIGGIGVFIVMTAIEVTINQQCTLEMKMFRVLFIENVDLFGVVLFFETFLRACTWITYDTTSKSPKYPLLPPLFFCLITPLFYLALMVLPQPIDIPWAEENGYFFPSPATETETETTIRNDSNYENGGGLFLYFHNHGQHIFDLLRIINFQTISWMAVIKSIATMIALTAFSLIHVPINIPAFSISTDVDTDMNAELISHGYSNALSGVFGGLPNYMTYTVSLLYAKSGGYGHASSLVISFLTFIFFIIGPDIATYIPRCMAGTLLLHVGLDLFLEGVYDSYGSYDLFEYCGIWLITIVMTTMGMSAALIAGIIVALATYAVQSITHLNPILATMNASTLRSSFWSRCEASSVILEDSKTGRSRIFVIQLQGHLFFGNIAQLTDTIKKLIAEKEGTNQQPLIVIIDFTLVVGMDSSAAHAVAKLKSVLHRLFNVEVTVFVTGCDRGGFPCAYALSRALTATEQEGDDAVMDMNDIAEDEDESEVVDIKLAAEAEFSPSVFSPRGSVSVAHNSSSFRASQVLYQLPRNRVCESLDDALSFAEDILVARESPNLLEQDNRFLKEIKNSKNNAQAHTTVEEDKRRAMEFMRKLCKDPDSEETKHDLNILFSFFEREEFSKNQILWKQNSVSDCAKLLVTGTLVAHSIIDGASECASATGSGFISEYVPCGSIVGELGLVHDCKRFNTLECTSETAVLYSLSIDSWNRLLLEQPKAARIIYAIVVRYLAHRVQHVSNRVFDKGGLPI